MNDSELRELAEKKKTCEECYLYVRDFSPDVVISLLDRLAAAERVVEAGR